MKNLMIENFNFASALELILPVLDEVYSRYEADAALEITASASAGSKVTCKKGCGACCHFPVIPATAGEAFVLIARLLAQGFGLEVLHQKFSAYAKTYFEYSRSKGSLPLTDEQQHAFLTLRLPCPLFEGESGTFRGHCSVFGIRPLICDFYHSTEAPQLCAEKQPHGSVLSLMARGEFAVEEIRQFERMTFGRSALGHLPLLLAALCTKDGMSAFLTKNSEAQECASEEHVQARVDFEFYIELLRAAGYEFTRADIDSLLKAQEDIAAQMEELES